MLQVNGDENALGNYLKDRRAKLDPATFGFSAKRRRTPGLRREEVAQRANVSVTWYTWLEQGRGGTPSEDVLDGIADALTLTPDEREHLFLLAQHRPPQARYQKPESITPQLQRLLDAMEFCPAIIRNVTWDIIAWNHAAVKVLTEYETIAPEQRNLLRLFFCDPCAPERMAEWECHARAMVATFRAEIARVGASEIAAPLIADLSRCSPAFDAIWREHDVRTYRAGVKQLHNSRVGAVTLEYSSFAVEGCPELSLLLFAPATPEDGERIKALVSERG